MSTIHPSPTRGWMTMHFTSHAIAGSRASSYWLAAYPLGQYRTQPVPKTDRKFCLQPSVGAQVGVVRRYIQSTNAARTIGLQQSQFCVDLFLRQSPTPGVEIGETLFHFPMLKTLLGGARKALKNSGNGNDSAHPSGSGLVICRHSDSDRTAAKQGDRTEQQINTAKQTLVQSVPTLTIANVKLCLVLAPLIVLHRLLRKVNWATGAEQAAAQDYVPGGRLPALGSDSAEWCWG